MFSNIVFVQKVAGNILIKYLSSLTWDQTEISYCKLLQLLFSQPGSKNNNAYSLTTSIKLMLVQKAELGPILIISRL